MAINRRRTMMQLSRIVQWSLVTAVVVVGLVGVGVVQAQAVQRVTPLLSGLDDGHRWGEGSVYGDALKIVDNDNGQLPIVEHGGRKAMAFRAGPAKTTWLAQLARSWVRFYVADYLPGGYMELTVCGERGGEQFTIGIGDSGKGKRDSILGMVPISRYAKLTTDWQTIRIPIVDLAAAGKGIDLDDLIKVVIYGVASDQPQHFYISQIQFVTDAPERVYPPIKVDQVGYRPNDWKIAKISADVSTFRVVDVSTGEAVYEGATTLKQADDKASGDTIREANFTVVHKPGRYRIEAEGLEPSAQFDVRDDVYDHLFVDSVRFYYFQRCNIELLPKYTGGFRREACHMADAHAKCVANGDVRDVTGGWHDAGDCNKYPAFLANALIMPLSIYDLRPGAFTDGQLNIPESGNGVPDLLDEMQWELDWLLKMQITEGPRAGAVYDRLHTSAPGGDASGPVLDQVRGLVEPTNQSTAFSAMNWAMASRIFATIPQRREQAAKYLAAAKLAWGRLVADKAPDEQLLCAAAGLYDATGDAEYAQAVQDILKRLYGPNVYPRNIADRFLFSDYGAALCVLAVSKHGGPVRELAQKLVKTGADFAVEAWSKDGYGSPLWDTDHYCWGSTSSIGRLGFVCLTANRFSPNPQYVQLAQDALHYMLGRNAVDTCMVTGYGTNTTVIFHSVYGTTTGATLPTPPGIMPGGVNQWESRGISAYPAKHYKADPDNWTINEPALYYNAPLVYLAGYFAQLKP
jgi:endoglucanase